LKRKSHDHSSVYAGLALVPCNLSELFRDANSPAKLVLEAVFRFDPSETDLAIHAAMYTNMTIAAARLTPAVAEGKRARLLAKTIKDELLASSSKEIPVCIEPSDFVPDFHVVTDPSTDELCLYLSFPPPCGVTLQSVSNFPNALKFLVAPLNPQTHPSRALWDRLDGGDTDEQGRVRTSVFELLAKKEKNPCYTTFSFYFVVNVKYFVPPLANIYRRTITGHTAMRFKTKDSIQEPQQSLSLL